MRAPATPSEAERFPFDPLDEVWPWSAAAVPPGPAVPLAPSPAPVPAEILAFPDAVAAGTAAAPAAAGIGTPAARSPAAGNAAAMGQNGPGDSSATPTAAVPSETGVGSAADAAPAGEDARTPILPGAAGDLPAACNAAATGQDGPGRIPGAQGAAEAAAGGGSGGNGPAGAADPPPGPGPEVLRHHDGERGRGAADLLPGPGPAPEARGMVEVQGPDRLKPEPAGTSARGGRRATPAGPNPPAPSAPRSRRASPRRATRWWSLPRTGIMAGRWW